MHPHHCLTFGEDMREGHLALRVPFFVGRGHPRCPPCLKLDLVRLSVNPAWGLSATPTQGASDTRHPDTSDKIPVETLGVSEVSESFSDTSDTRGTCKVALSG